MKVGVCITLSENGIDRDQLVEGARLVERIGFDGLWFFDTIGRARALPDPLIALSVAAAVTDKIILGTCIYQVPLRNPVELAHRMMTVKLLAGNRLLWGVGAGSTQADFSAVGEDYEGRFAKLRDALPNLRKLWAGETVDGTNLQPWPVVRSGPKTLIGSWAGSTWIPRAAKEFDGWIASAHYTNFATMKEGLGRFRDEGGDIAVAANIKVDLTKPTESLEGQQGFTLECAPKDAKVRLAEVARAGFDHCVLVVDDASEENLRAIRALI
ncbi:MAG: LLM class flavin-dependent oxidoreductase [Pseudomonadota bacterium]|nr:LLM class flavin-dependent oxidoreductase [Pseudomonadota bacterium]